MNRYGKIVKNDAGLKPCPFCGGEASTSQERFERTLLSWVFCTSCGAACGYRYTEAEAIEAWNTRAERTCHNTQNDFDFMCSNCGKMLDNGRVIGVNYCPNCGAMVVE